MLGKLIIVLGYTLSQNCTMEPILKSRLDEGVKIYQEEDVFLVCGKTSPKAVTPIRCEAVSQAEVMKKYLIEQGIPEHDIIKEEKSTTTFGNIFYSFELIQKQMPRSIVIVANEFHCPQIKYSFHKIFGSKHPYSFQVISDESLGETPEEIEKRKATADRMISTYYPLLFSHVEDGDFRKVKEVVEGPIDPKFRQYVKNLFNLDDSADIRDLIAG